MLFAIDCKSMVLPVLRRSHDEPTLALANGSHEVHHPGAVILPRSGFPDRRRFPQGTSGVRLSKRILSLVLSGFSKLMASTFNSAK